MIRPWAGAPSCSPPRWLHRRGEDPARIGAECLFGADIDPVAVAAPEAALALWAWTVAGKPERPPAIAGRHRLVAADLRFAGSDAWPDQPPGGFAAVVGNPPFLNQLARSTARSAVDRVRLQDRWGPAAHGYVDTAALFLLAGCQLVRPGGRVALVQPESMLVTHHAQPLREAVLARAELDGLWIGRDPHFSAGVRVCAPVLTVKPTEPAPVARAGSAHGSNPRPLVLRRRHGSSAVVGPPGRRRARHPARRAAHRRHAHRPRHRRHRRLPQFYGLAPHVRDHPASGGGESTPIRRHAAADPGAEHPPLVTVGLIDPLVCRWGDRSARFAGRRWCRPVVDRAALAAANPPLARWVDDRLGPKVLVATQTKVVEAVIDGEGHMVPSVPVVAVAAPVDRLALVAAVLLAPPISAWALHRVGGGALTADAIKLSARQVLEVPLPADEDRWRRAADLLAESDPGSGPAPDPADFGAEMGAAYGLAPDHPVLGWWLGRLTSWG